MHTYTIDRFEGEDWAVLENDNAHVPRSQTATAAGRTRRRRPERV